MSVKDFINNSQRVDPMPQPLWITSKEVNVADIKNNNLVAFSFKPGFYVVHEVMLEEIVNITGTSGIDVTIGTAPLPQSLATPAQTYDGATISNAANLAVDMTTETIIALDASIPFVQATDQVVICIKENDANTITAGKFRVHVLVSKVPTVSI